MVVARLPLAAGIVVVVLGGCSEPRARPPEPSTPRVPSTRTVSRNDVSPVVVDARDAGAPRSAASSEARDADAGVVGASDAGVSSGAETGAGAKRITLTDPALRPWVEARVAASKAGSRERVRIPLVRQANGWGCVCPPHYVGNNGLMQQGPWLDVTFGKGVRALRAGQAVMAEGTFGAVSKHVRYPGGPPPTDYWEYDLLPFTVTSMRALTTEEEDEDVVALERL